MLLILQRIGLLIYALLTMVEGAVNFFFYLIFLDKKGIVADISLPFHAWWSDNVTKPFWLKKMRKQDATNFNRE
jgi:hypothetical protein